MTDRRGRVCALTTLILMFSLQMFSQQKNSAGTTSSAQSFLGRWDLTLKAPLREYPSWLEISEENGQLTARMVSRWGHARPLAQCELPRGPLTFGYTKGEEVN